EGGGAGRGRGGNPPPPGSPRRGGAGGRAALRGPPPAQGGARRAPRPPPPRRAPSEIDPPSYRGRLLQRSDVLQPPRFFSAFVVTTSASWEVSWEFFVLVSSLAMALSASAGSRCR